MERKKDSDRPHRVRSESLGSAAGGSRPLTQARSSFAAHWPCHKASDHCVCTRGGSFGTSLADDLTVLVADDQVKDVVLGQSTRGDQLILFGTSAPLPSTPPRKIACA